jgi:hypothetical protein
MLKFIPLCFLVLIISTCSHEQISFSAIENKSEALRLDGRYFQLHKGDKKAGLSDFFLGYIFYKNGVVLRLGGDGNDISPDYKLYNKPDSINCFVPKKLSKTECEKLYR